VDRSFFLTQLERRGIHVAAGPQAYLLSIYSAAVVMRSRDSPRAASDEACQSLLEQGIKLGSASTLEVAMPMFEKGGHVFIPVVAPAAEGAPEQVLGAVFYVDALRAYNRALAATAAEEHS
jgi:CIC family chloride channel protein